MEERVIKKIKECKELTEGEKCVLREALKGGYGLRYKEYKEPMELQKDTHKVVIEEVSELRIGKGEGPRNRLYEGDNLHTLEYLKNQGEKVDLIYIDPPYNTQNKRGFTYKDSMGSQEDRHSKWLSFMGKRLERAYNLLADDGVMFISIDEREVSQLKLLCDSIFGEESYITQFVWLSSSKSIEDLEESEEIKTTGANLGMFKSSYEYILSYRKTKEFRYKLVESSQKEIHSRVTKKGNYQSIMRVPKGTRCEARELELYGYIGGESERIEILTGEGIVVKGNRLQYDVDLRGPFANPLMVKDYFEGKEVRDRKGQLMSEVYLKGTGIPYMKKEKKGEIVSNVLSGYGDTSKWARELDQMMGKKGVFAHPKPYPMIEYLINLHPRKDIRVLDFFAGSGTTGQAVMELNKKDGGEREFILCTNNEYQIEKEVEVIKANTDVEIELKSNGRLGKRGETELEEYRKTEGYKVLEERGLFEDVGICRSVTYPRIRHVIEGYKTKREKVEGIPCNLEYKRVTYKKK